MPEATQNKSGFATALLVTRRHALLLAVAVLVIFHGVGLWGLAFSGNAAYFQSLTPLNLLLTNTLLFSFHRRWNKTFLLFALVVFAIGFLVEVVGVHTGLLFGNYRYGNALGYKLWDVPLLIGLNWLMLIYATGTIVEKLKAHWLLKALAAAGLMVLLDIFIEPVAVKFDFWSWHAGVIPVFNFICWFVVAYLLQVFFQKKGIYKRNKLAIFVYMVQLAFFAVLYLMITW